MNLRTLLLSLFLAAAGCAIDIPSQVPCNTNTDCPPGQLCGEDSFCREAKDCKTGQVRCGGVCTDLSTTLHCGACGTSCNPGEQCTPGTNAKPTCSLYCAAGLTSCSAVGAGSSCKDLNHDSQNCGVCGSACANGKQCRPDATGLGKCVTVCADGLDLCGGACVDSQTDARNCGTCGHACGPSQLCSAGACKTACPSGLSECSPGKCLDTSADSNNCGGCGIKCGAGLVCNNSQCSLTCGAGLSVCGSTCVRTASDPNNCGGCTTGTTKTGASRDNFACDPGYACKPNGPNNSGVCEIECPAGQSACSASCVDFSTDRLNCGGCGQACGSGQRCESNHCVLTCGSGQISCNGACVDPKSDRANCGGCGVTCPSGQVCGATGCATSCPASEKNCGGSCVDVNVDRNNCGACGVQCPAGQVCNGTGTCTPSCPSGSVNCNGLCVDPTHDNANCGACNASCAAGTSCQPTAGANGVTGQCTANCGASLVACGATCRDTQNDPKNCGGCGTSCVAGQGCVTGQCKVVCPAGLTACAVGAGTVCKDLQNDSNNCGQCGGLAGSQPCAAGSLCKAGVCQVTCPSDLTSCGATCTNFSFDPNNCGACGTRCGPFSNSTPYCASGSCAPACTAGFADCNNKLSDGCETNLGNDPLHCGGCLNACAAPDNSSATCGGGVCGSACKGGFNDCDADRGNGCESNASSDALHCGGCATNCAVQNGGAAPFCSGSTCVASFTGVEQNVDKAALIANGWRQCYVGTYADSTSVASIQAACNPNGSATALLMACRPAGASLLTVAASGSGGATSDLFQDTGAAGTHSAAGVSWYFNGTTSWGFAPAGASVNRSICDVAGGAQDQFAAGFGTQRLCWLTVGGNLSAGGRCGDREAPGSAFERLVFTKP